METEYRGRLFHAMGGNYRKYPSSKKDREREAQLEKDMIALMKEDFNKRTEFYEANKGKYLTDKEREYLEKIAGTSKGIDAVAAKMLLAVSEDNVTKEIMQAKLTEALDSYKAKLIEQTTKDLPRNSILVKSPSGKVHPVSIERIDALEISGAQKDFIKTAWQQGTFGGGWIGSAFPVTKAMDTGQTFAGTRNNYVLLDLSTRDNVKLYSSTDSMQAPLDDPENSILHSKGTLEVDISTLTGNEFTPCISAHKPNIRAIVTENITYYLVHRIRIRQFNF